MCGPAAVAGVAGGAQLFGTIQARGQAKAQNRFNQKQYETNRDEALRAMVLEISGTQRRQAEEQLSASQALLQLNREAGEAIGTARASTTNVEGNSVKALLDDYRRQELIRVGVAEHQLKITLAQGAENIEAIRGQAQSRITAGIPQPVPVPTLLNSAIQIGNSALGGYLQAGGTFK